MELLNSKPNGRNCVLTIFVDIATPCTLLEFFVGFSFAIGDRSRKEIERAGCTASYQVRLKRLHVFRRQPPPLQTYFEQPESSPGQIQLKTFGFVALILHRRALLEGDIGTSQLTIDLARRLTKGCTMYRSHKNPIRALRESPTNLFRKVAWLFHFFGFRSRLARLEGHQVLFKGCLHLFINIVRFANFCGIT